jgi:NADPH-dependent 2,4-dienoyl-CoA reductase/sulfur reductase-like enzyme
MENTDVLIIGGGPAAIIAAVTAKSNYPEKNVTLLKKIKRSMVPCGIPYIFGTLNDVSKNVMGDAPLENAGVKIIIDEAVGFDIKAKKAVLSSGGEIGYDRLVIATGSSAICPSWLEGRDKKKVYFIEKNGDYLEALYRDLKDLKKIVIVGGGFIGVEMADELARSGRDVTVVELMEHVLMAAFDPDVAVRAEDVLKARGVKIKAGSGIKRITGGETADGVELENGEKIAAEAVILAMGYSPNSSVAAKAGLEINSFGFIKVDEYMRTSAGGVFAAGDCAEKRDFITRKPCRIMLASTATTEARVAGMNLYKLSTEKSFNGTISIFDTRFGNFSFGVAGVTENGAKKEGLDYVSGDFEGVDRHPGTIPGAGKQYVKILAMKDTGTIIGGEVAGAESAGEIANLIGLAIQNKMSVFSIITSQIGTHPLLTAAPTNYPLIKAAEAAVKKIKSK